MKKLFVVGDSISIQYGPYLEPLLDGFVHYARKEGHSEAMKNLDVPKGANGGNSKMVRLYLESVLPSKEVASDYIMLNCGLHDIKRSELDQPCAISLDEYEENLQAILDLIKQFGIEVIWVTTTPVDDETHNHEGALFYRLETDLLAINEIASRVMVSREIPVIDLYSFSKDLGLESFCDHVHYHEWARQEQAVFIDRELRKIIS